MIRNIKIFALCAFIVSFLFLFIFLPKFLYTKKTYNVILISIDLLNAHHLSSYGHPTKTTPFLDDFFAGSYVFLNTIAPSSWTTPSTMSMFTSLYPSDHKIIHIYSGDTSISGEKVVLNLKTKNPRIITLAEVLKKNGYITAAFNGNAGIRPEIGFDQGFDIYQKNPNKEGQKLSHNLFSFSIPPAIEWLKKNKNKPFFLFLQGFDLHGKNELKQGYSYRYMKQSYAGKFKGTGDEYNKLTERETGLYEGISQLTSDDIEFWKNVYDEKINSVDTLLKDFFDSFQNLDLFKNTIIIITSSHGQEYYEHKDMGYGHTLYQELLHVPLAIRLPEQKEGKRIKDLVSTIDIMPTILSFLNIKNPAPYLLKGANLSPAFFNKDVSRDVYAETEKFRNTKKQSIQTIDGWKLILSFNDDNTIQKKELYNLIKDPEEQQNLVEKEIQKTYELEQEIIENKEQFAFL